MRRIAGTIVFLAQTFHPLFGVAQLRRFRLELHRDAFDFARVAVARGSGLVTAREPQEALRRIQLALQLMFVKSLFKLMADTEASDLFFTAGAPVQIKIKGDLVPVDGNVLDAPTMKRIAYEAMTEEQIATFERDLEINFSLVERGIGSFRVNIFKQRGACGIVIRHIQVAIPTVEHLGLPPILKEFVLEKRGLILVVGATGSGKSSTLAAMRPAS